MLLFGPILMPLGLLLLFATIAALAFPLIYSALFFIEGRYLLGAILLPLALLWTRLCSRVLNKLLAGVEHSSL
jgi:hypothetical protein